MKITCIMYCPSLTASPTNFIAPVFDPPVRIRAFVDFAALINPSYFNQEVFHTTVFYAIFKLYKYSDFNYSKYTLNVSFFLPSRRKFFAPPTNESAKCG